MTRRLENRLFPQHLQGRCLKSHLRTPGPYHCIHQRSHLLNAMCLHEPWQKKDFHDACFQKPFHECFRNIRFVKFVTGQEQPRKTRLQ